MITPVVLNAEYQLSSGPNGHRSVQSRRNRGSFVDVEIFLRLPNVSAAAKDALRQALHT